jgi:hypothetical protein
MHRFGMRARILAASFVLALSACSASSAPTSSTGADDASTIDAPASGDTWSSYASGFFTTYCVECHGGGGARDYRTIADVQRDASLVACGVATTTLAGCASFPPPKQFPIDDATKTNPKPSDAERARLVAWIQAGTP